MRKIQKFSAALVVAAMMAAGMTIFSTPVYASDGGSTQLSGICALLERAEAAVNALPASGFKTYVLAAIEAAEAKYGCP